MQYSHKSIGFEQSGIAATDWFRLKPLFHPGEQVFSGSPPGLRGKIFGIDLLEFPE